MGYSTIRRRGPGGSLAFATTGERYPEWPQLAGREGAPDERIVIHHGLRRVLVGRLEDRDPRVDPSGAGG
jgi:hypothetical protein